MLREGDVSCRPTFYLGKAQVGQREGLLAMGHGQQFSLVRTNNHWFQPNSKRLIQQLVLEWVILGLESSLRKPFQLVKLGMQY